MTRRQRTETLVRGPSSLAAQLAAQVRSYHKVRIIQAPEEGMVMTTIRESARESLFHLGEVLVTEARVTVDGILGLGLVRQSDPELALDLACIDAAYNAHSPLVEAWEDPLQAGWQALQDHDLRTFAQVLATKVTFDSMDRMLP